MIGPALAGECDRQVSIDKGATLDAVNNKGWTPLTVADGVEYAGSLKSAPETAALIRKIVADNTPAIDVRR